MVECFCEAVPIVKRWDKVEDIGLRETYLEFRGRNIKTIGFEVVVDGECYQAFRPNYTGLLMARECIDRLKERVEKAKRMAK